MKKWAVTQLGSPEEALQIVETKTPTRQDGEVLVEIKASAMNFFDILQCKGEYQEKHALPFTPGAESSGIIVDPGNSQFKKGERVIAVPKLPNGSYSQLISINQDYVFPMPESMNWNDGAAMFITYHTVYFALLRTANIQRGETLLVHAGTGGVGSAAIQLGKAFGAKVIATAGSDEKTAICKELGADHVVNYRKENFITKVKELTDGKGADVIFDPVGGDVFDKSRKCIAFEGRILIIGFASGQIPTAPTNHLLVKNYSLLGVHWGYFWKLYPESVRENHQKLIQLYEKGLIKPLIYKEYDFEQLPKGLNDLAERKTWGKLILKVK